MSKLSICEREKNQLEKLNKFQLGNQFKKIGLFIAIGTFALMIGRKYIENSEWLRPILHGVLLIGLLIISLSKEKIEDEFNVELSLINDDFLNNSSDHMNNVEKLKFFITQKLSKK